MVESGGRVIVDGRSSRTFRFYAGDRVDSDSITSIGDQEAINSIDPDSGTDLMVIHNDWKAYQLLNLKQNWNSGSSSASKVDRVSGIESFLREGGYRGDWGLVRFPLHAFIYSPGDEGSLPIPSVMPIAYRDLEFPRKIGGQQFIGAARLSEGRSVIIEKCANGQTEISWFLKGGAKLEPGTPIGTLNVSNESIPIEVGPMPESAFEAGHCRAIGGSTVVDQWRKRPLISQASRYPGSFFPAEGRIYGRTVESGDSVTVRVSHPDVELVILVPEPVAQF